MSPTRTSAPETPTTEQLLGELRHYLRPDPPALSLPSQVFTSPELYEAERERIFGRSWIMVAHRDQLAAPGDYLALDIAGEPVVVARGNDGLLLLMLVDRNKPPHKINHIV